MMSSREQKTVEEKSQVTQVDQNTEILRAFNKIAVRRAIQGICSPFPKVSLIQAYQSAARGRAALPQSVQQLQLVCRIKKSQIENNEPPFAGEEGPYPPIDHRDSLLGRGAKPCGPSPYHFENGFLCHALTALTAAYGHV